MYNGLLHAHSGLRWILLIALIFAVVTAIVRWKKGSGFSVGGRVLNLVTMISTHIQLLLGLVLYFISPNVQLEGMFDVAKIRFFTLEHFILMIVAIVLITIGYGKVKKAEKPKSKNRLTVIYYGIALLLILISIPWPFREQLGGSWF